MIEAAEAHTALSSIPSLEIYSARQLADAAMFARSN
jgi:hypothetical protein